jgi:sucrose-6-phosphate hydrolase SacC (GH32 family)
MWSTIEMMTHVHQKVIIYPYQKLSKIKNYSKQLKNSTITRYDQQLILSKFKHILHSFQIMNTKLHPKLVNVQGDWNFDKKIFIKTMAN